MCINHMVVMEQSDILKTMSDELKDYIENQRKQGVSDEEIRNELSAQGGWAEEDLNVAFNITQATLNSVVTAVPKKNNSSAMKKEISPKGLLIIGVTILLLLYVPAIISCGVLCGSDKFMDGILVAVLFEPPLDFVLYTALQFIAFISIALGVTRYIRRKREIKKAQNTA